MNIFPLPCLSSIMLWLLMERDAQNYFENKTVNLAKKKLQLDYLSWTKWLKLLSVRSFHLQFSPLGLNKGRTVELTLSRTFELCMVLLCKLYLITITI